MNEQKGFLTKLGEMIDQHRADHRTQARETASQQRTWLRWLGRQMIPNIGTLMLVVILLLTVPSLAAPRSAPNATSTSTISYQGRLADSAGNPVNDDKPMIFRLYDVPSGGVPVWTEHWDGPNSVQVSDGLFNVMLGSIDPSLATAVEGHDELYLGITVDTDNEMVPRVQLGSVPFSLQAMTVPDSSITSAKIAAGAVTQEKAPGLIQSNIGDNRKIWAGMITGVADQNGWIVQPFSHNLSHVDSGAITPMWPANIWYTGSPPTFGSTFSSIIVAGGLTPGESYTFSVILIGE